MALQYIQVGAMSCLKGNHSGVSLLSQVHKQRAPTDLEWVQEIFNKKLCEVCL